MNTKPLQLYICLALLFAVALCAGCSFGQTDAQASKGVPEATPAPTLPPTDNVNEIVRRWKAASDSIKTARFRRHYEQVNADGSRSPLPNDWGVPLNIEMVYDMVPQDFLSGPPYEHSRYRFVAHFAKGDFIQVYDGERSYRYYSWLKELHTQMKEAEIPGLNDYIEGMGSYLIDGHGSIIERGLAPDSKLESNSNFDYKYLGTQILDGRELIKINGNSTIIYLDAATYLPARFSDYLFGSRDLPDFETVITDLVVNSPVTENDFRIKTTEDAVHIQCCEYDSTNYSTVQEAARAVDFRIFAPLISDEEGQSGQSVYTITQGSLDIQTFYLVDSGGKSSEGILEFTANGGQIAQGTFMPRVIHEAGLFYASPPPLDESQIEVGGHKATLLWSVDPITGFLGRLYFERDGTAIHIISGDNWTKDDLIQFAESLQPIETTP